MSHCIKVRKEKQERGQKGIQTVQFGAKNEAQPSQSRVKLARLTSSHRGKLTEQGSLDFEAATAHTAEYR